MGNRLKIAGITPRGLLQLFIEGNSFTCVAGVPQNAMLVRADYVYETNQFNLLIESDSFDCVDEAERIPQLEVRFSPRYD